MLIIEFTLTARVHSSGCLIEAARRQCRDAGDAEATVLEMIPDGDAAAALHMLLDPGSVPGCDVLGSDAEITSGDAPAADETEQGAVQSSEDCCAPMKQS